MERLFRNKKTGVIRQGNAAEKVYNAVIFIVLTLYCASLLLILVWMLLSSFKTEVDYALNQFGFPQQWTWENFAYIFDPDKMNLKINTGQGLVQFGIWDMFLNSLIRSGVCTLVIVFVMTLVAYVLARYKFIGNKFIYALGIFVMVCPVVGNLPSAMLVRKALGIYDNLVMYILTCPYNIFGLHFLIIYGALKGIPQDYTEAAMMDGAGHYRIMFAIILPMVLPTCAVVYVLNFLSSWNDYMLQLTWLPSYPNLAYGMYRFQTDASGGGSGVGVPTIMAGFVVVMIPTVLLYLSMQNIIVSRFTVGGIKG